jgi:hypothetical protein
MRSNDISTEVWGRSTSTVRYLSFSAEELLCMVRLRHQRPLPLLLHQFLDLCISTGDILMHDDYLLLLIR